MIGEQKMLAEKAVLKDSFSAVRRIGGVDCSYLDDEYVIAGLVVLDYDTLRPVYRTFDVLKLDFPYIPGLLAYREAPAMIAAVSGAKVKPDVLMVDGFGVNHPRKCGIACHVGIKTGLPTIGVGKSFLCGTIKNKDIYQDSEKVGKIIHSKGIKKPIYVSAGHMISLATAVKIVRACKRNGRLPEPTRLAHDYVTGLKQKVSGYVLNKL